MKKKYKEHQRRLERSETRALKGYIALIIMTLISFAFTPAAFRYAAACRGFIRGVGGEIFVPFAGLIIWLVWQELEQVFRPQKHREVHR